MPGAIAGGVRDSRGQDQSDLFLRSEGDAWFLRNQPTLDSFDAGRDLPLRLIDAYGMRPGSVLEIGASNGVRLAALLKRGWVKRAVAVEASAAAIEDGRRRHPGVEFFRGESSALPLDGPFDAVIVNFVLHWVDRSRLLATYAEIDRVLRDGGHLILGDFLPTAIVRVPYHHLPHQDVYTYKQDYAAPLLASGLYHEVALFTARHDTHMLDAGAPEDERIAARLLQKRLAGHYPTRPRSGGALVGAPQ